MQFGPDAGAGAEGQQTNCFPATAQRQDEQPCAPILAALRIAHHGPGAVIDLRFLAGSGNDHYASLGGLRSAELAHEALHALVAAGETVLIHQVLVDGRGIAATAESQFDGFAVGFAGAGAGTALWRRHWRRGKSGVPAKPVFGFVGWKSAHFVWLGWVEVGDHLRVGNHLIGRF